MTNTKHSRIDSLQEDIEFELIKQGKMSEKKNKDYVNNKELYQEFVAYHSRKMKALEAGENIPPLTDKIGRAIIQIATRRCNSRSYVGYTNNWKEEMISNAITVAACNGHNFNPSKSENPFAYLTQICDHAIKEQLKREKKQVYLRYKMYDEARGFAAELDDEELGDFIISNNETDDAYSDRLRYINDYEERNFTKKPKAPIVDDQVRLDFEEEADFE